MIDSATGMKPGERYANSEESNEYRGEQTISLYAARPL
jgi:hypothetical protein